MSKISAYPFPDLGGLSQQLRDELDNRRSLNVYRMLMHSPAFAPAYCAMADVLLRRSSLPDKWREMIILRVGHRYDAPYELYHHEKLACKAGVGQDIIAALQPDADRSVLSEQESLLIEMVDEVLDHHGLSVESRDMLATIFSSVQLADFIFTIGFYQLVCNFLTTFGVPLEADA